MKAMKKMLALLLALTMVFGLATTAFAAKGDDSTADGEDPGFSITIKNDKKDVSIGGHTFNVYQIFDVTYKGDSFTYTFTDAITAIAKENQFFVEHDFDGDGVKEKYWGDRNTNPPTKQKIDEKEVTVDTSLLYYLENVDQTFDSAVMNDFAADFLGWMKSYGIAPVKTVEMKDDDTRENVEQKTVSMDKAGYYLITGDGEDKDGNKVVAGITLTTTSPDPTVQPKLDATSLEKKATDHLLDEAGKAAKSEIGKTVPYEIKTQVPNMTGCETFTFRVTDTMTKGLTFNASTLAVKINTTNGILLTEESSDTDKASPYAYTLNTTTGADGETIAVINFPNIINIAQEEYDKDIVITYNCTVDDDALDYHWEKNTATVSYGRDPLELTESTPKVVYVYDVSIVVDKYANGNTETKLPGAMFVLRKNFGTATEPVWKYYKWNDPVLDDVDKTNDIGSITWVDAESDDLDDLAKDTSIDRKVTDDNGKVEFEGLETGDYQLVEVAAPDGYNLLVDPVNVKVVIKVNEDGSFNAEGSTVDVDEEGKLVNDSITQTVSIDNKSGNKLPETGGIGTTIFYVIGSVLMLGAAVMLITKKRVNM